MHPLLSRFRQFALYLAAWVPIAGLLAYLMVGRNGLSWTEAAIINGPLCALYAFVCLAAWYSCRATPLEKSGLGKLLLTHLTAAVILSTLWVHLAKGFVVLLIRWRGATNLDERFAKYAPLLWVTGVLLYLLAVTFYYVLLAEQASREAQERVLQAQVLARDAELRALRAQVNPHFLFNCLHSISALTSSDSAKAREMCILLADFLRTTLRLGGKETVTLDEELALVRGYLAIEKVRFGPRVHMEEDVKAETLGVLIPPLLLQPLVENAIRHGIANLPEGGVIRLAADREGEALHILVENSFDPDSPSPLKTGLGLENIRQRLNTRYGRDAKIAVRTDGNLFFVDLTLPAIQGVEA
jgi:two-component system sensor histidine kinase AlgZ